MGIFKVAYRFVTAALLKHVKGARKGAWVQAISYEMV